jgi:hypothetical protein
MHQFQAKPQSVEARSGKKYRAKQNNQWSEGQDVYVVRACRLARPRGHPRAGAQVNAF